jgi:preprotein translocase subunit SecA
MDAAIDEAVLAALDQVTVSGRDVDLKALDLKGPSSTWTYVVNDDPFRNQIGRMLTGPGRTTVAIAAAALTMPLLVLWGVADRLFGRRPGRRSDLRRGEE